MSPVSTLVQLLAELHWYVRIPNAAKHSEYAKLRFVFQEGLQGSYLTAFLVGNPVQSVSRNTLWRNPSLS